MALRDRIDSVIDAVRPGDTTADAAKHFPPAKTGVEMLDSFRRDKILVAGTC